jgi:hypothetical protein
VDKKLKRPSAATSEPPIGYKLRYQYPIIPPRILARADEAIEQAHRHVGFWPLTDIVPAMVDVCCRGQSGPSPIAGGVAF